MKRKETGCDKYIKAPKNYTFNICKTIYNEFVKQVF